MDQNAFHIPPFYPPWDLCQVCKPIGTTQSWLHRHFLNCDIDGIGGVILGAFRVILGRLVLVILTVLRSCTTGSANIGLIGILEVLS